MSICDGLQPLHPHVALLPSAGMGHLTPFLRLAALLIHHNCRVTLIIPHPTVSLAESRYISRFLSAFPQATPLQFHLLPLDPSTANSTDPFFLRFEAIRRSAHLLSPVLNSLSPPLHALVYDMTLISSVVPVTETLRLRDYILFTSSARMFSFYSCFPALASKADDDFAIFGDVDIPGLKPIPRSSIPPLLLIRDSLFYKIFKEDTPKVTKLQGVLINTFEGLETESLNALGGKKVLEGLPNIFGVGPFPPCEFEREEYGDQLKWLDAQPAESVVYVSFGSRTATYWDQIRELGVGLLRSGYRFLWAVKGKKVDKEEEESLEEMLGEELVEKMMGKGLVVKNWVDQVQILGHTAVGGFVSHCGWNSVIEAAWNGVPILAWPQGGDQKINAEVVEMSGFGMWERSWDWGDKVVVKGENIGEKIREMMGSQLLRGQAARIKEEARKAVSSDGGTCRINFKRLTEEWKMISNRDI